MSVFILQMLIIMFAGKSVSERSHVPREARQSRRERYTGTMANFIWLLAMGYSIFLPLRIGTTWLYFGLFIFAIGLTFLVMATFNFIAANPNQLVTSGIYRFSRHPMYLAIFLISLGSGIAAVSVLFIFISIILFFCLHREALIEERYCTDKYGSDYSDYLSRVPRWIGLPRVTK